MKKRRSKRGFTDKVYLANFVCVHIIVLLIVILTAFSGRLGITDMSALAALPACAYGELAIHSAVVARKNEKENVEKIKGEQVIRIE